MILRDATPADTPAIREIGELTWPATYSFAGSDYIAHGLATWWSDEALDRSLRDTTVLVAEDGEQLVGIGNLDVRGEAPVIWKLYVRPDMQGNGVGRALLEALIARAGERPIRLEYVDGNDRAAAFYARYGFREIRREPAERPGWPDLVWVERAPERQYDARFLQVAIEQARIGRDEGGIPIGAALVVDGELLAVGHNRRVQLGSAIRHGETDCLENAGRLPASTYARATMYTTLSPCPMCTGAILLYKIPRVVIGENRTFLGAEDLLRASGVEATVADDAQCVAMMREFIAAQPDLWNEDIGV